MTDISDDEPVIISLTADRLLCALQAVTPFASKDEERPHLTMVKFLLEPHSELLTVEATNGHALARLQVPIESGEPVSFGLMSTHVPTIEKVLSRLDPERRQTLAVDLTVDANRIRLTCAETDVFVPRSAIQLEFESTKRAIPALPLADDKVTTTFGVDPVLLGKSLRAAAHVADSLQWSVPRSPIDPIRLDVFGHRTCIEGLFIVMPMRLGAKGAEDGEAPSDPVSEAAARFKETLTEMGASASMVVDGKETLLFDGRPEAQ